MSNYFTGHAAESVAANYLKDQGFKIHKLNWRTKYCEIDIIAEKSQVIYLIEVKYRKSKSWGQGIDYITPKKLKQMSFAAEMWVHDHAWSGEYRLAVLSLDEQEVEFTEIV